MAVEVTVSIKGEDSTFKHKYLIYDDFTMNHDDKIIQALIEQTLDLAKIEPDDIKVRALLQIQ